MVRPAGAARLVAVALLAAACGDVDTVALRLVRVAPEADPACGAPAGARLLQLRAVGEFPPAEAPARTVDVAGGAVALDGFPASLAALEVEVLGAGGERLAVGRSGAIELGALADGAEVAVFTAPVEGACPTGPPLAARDGARVVAVRGGALIAGGRDADGAPVAGLERYDAATGRFEALAAALYGDELAAGLAGASMTALADGRVALIGGAATAYQLIDPATGEAATPAFLREARGHHAAVALGDGRVFLAGGCAQLAGAACVADTALRSTSILDVDSGALVTGPALAVERIGAVALLEGDGRVLVIGGVDASGAPHRHAERIDPSGERPRERVDGTAAAAARLPGGPVVTAFAPAGAAASGELALVPPGGAAARALVTSGAPRAGTTLVALEDGGALAVGGAPLWFAPLTGRLRAGDGAAIADGAAARATAPRWRRGGSCARRCSDR